jgi:hypothetical protein
MAGLLATLSPQKEPGESGGSSKASLGKGVGGALAREGSPGLVVVAGVMADWRLGTASVPSGLPLASSHKINNIRAANRWPWV